MTVASPLTRTQVGRLGGRAKARKPGAMVAMSRLAVRTKGDRSLPTVAEWVRTPAGRKALARHTKEMGVTREEVLRVIGAR